MAPDTEIPTRSIEVCFTPKLINLFDYKDSIVVVIDVLRATSTICTALAYDAESITPVASIDDCLAYRNQGYLIAGERNGEMVDGFDMGNSPFQYINDKVIGRKIALTTTNGTQAIKAVEDAAMVVIGAFVNIDTLCRWLKNQDRNILCLCAGWKNKFNMEDSMLAGAIVHKLKNHFKIDCDSAITSEMLYMKGRHDLFAFLENSSHRRRLKRLHIESDIKYCLTPNQCNVIPIYQNGVITKLINTHI